MEEWYTFYTKPNSEKLVSQRLHDLRLDVFFPELRVQGKDGTPKKSTEPLFPCYLFACVDLTVQSPSTLRWLPGVRSIVGTYDAPLPIPVEIINTLRKKTAALNEAAKRPPTPFKKGDRVRIVNGPFENLVATFDQALTSSERVQILMEILGQVRRVKLPAANLRLEKKAEVHYNENKRSRRTRGKGRHIQKTNYPS